MWNQVSNEIRKALPDFHRKIAEKLEEDPKSFYANARENKVRVGIGSLKGKDKMVENSLEMAGVINAYFWCVFTRNIPRGNIEPMKDDLGQKKNVVSGYMQ